MKIMRTVAALSVAVVFTAQAQNKSVDRAKNELLIFMTPRILGGEGAATEQAANSTPPPANGTQAPITE